MFRFVVSWLEGGVYIVVFFFWCVVNFDGLFWVELICGC